MASLHDYAIRHQVALERLKAGQVQTFNQLLPELAAQVADVIAKLQGASLSRLKRGQLNAMLKSLQAAQDAALKAQQDKLMAELEKLSAYETGFETRVLTEVTGTRVASPDVDKAWQSVASTPLSATGHTLEPWVREMTQAEVATINRMILRGFSEGWTNDQLTTMLNGTKALKYADGLLPRMRTRNATIVRTAVQHVANASREVTWSANEDIIDKLRWTATLDNRTSELCASLDGQEFDIGDGPRPPAHPNCRSTMVPVLKGALRALGEGRTRASEDGPVDADMTYYEWLKAQPAAYQREVLGPGRYDIFKRDDMTADRFAKLQLNKAFQPLTLEQMRARL